MYHPIGMILDIILVATGIGKLPQAVIWAIIVALDIYEISTGDTEKETNIYLQFLMLGIDILGLVLSGGIAGVARETFAGIRTVGELTGLVSKNPAARNTLNQMAQSAAKTPSLLKSAAESLSKVFPIGESFIKGILGSLDFVLQRFLKAIGGLLRPKPIILTTAGLGAIYGVEQGIEKGAEYASSLFGGDDSQTIAQNSDEEEEFNKNLMSGEADYQV
jgi:hypothetical protein